MRLIDADALINDRYMEDAYGTTYGARTYVTFEEIENAPTIDPERNKGEWINEHWDGDASFQIDGRGNCWKVIECSVCNSEKKGSPTNYCPNCGAEMRGEDE